MTFGEKLRSARKKKDLTQRELAELIDVKHNSISNWENDQNKPDPDTIELICGALDITPNELLHSGKSLLKRINQTNETVIESIMEDIEMNRLNEISEILSRLNNLGQLEAIKRIEELSFITKYKREDSDLDFIKSTGIKTRDYLLPNAAHERTDIDATEEDMEHDDDIMNDEKF